MFTAVRHPRGGQNGRACHLARATGAVYLVDRGLMTWLAARFFGKALQH